MSVEAVQMFYVKCDADGCDARTPPADYEVIAWESYSSAEESAMCSDWTKQATLHFCPDHSGGA